MAVETYSIEVDCGGCGKTLALSGVLCSRCSNREAEIERLGKLVADAAIREIEWAARLLEACDLFDFKESGAHGVAKSQRMRIQELRRKAEP